MSCIRVGEGNKVSCIRVGEGNGASPYKGVETSP